MNTRVRIDKTSSEEEAVIEMKEDILKDLDKADDISDIISIGYSMIKKGLASYVYSEIMTKDEANKAIEEITNSFKLAIETAWLIMKTYKLRDSLK